MHSRGDAGEQGGQTRRGQRDVDTDAGRDAQGGAHGGASSAAESGGDHEGHVGARDGQEDGYDPEERGQHGEVNRDGRGADESDLPGCNVIKAVVGLHSLLCFLSRRSSCAG